MTTDRGNDMSKLGAYIHIDEHNRHQKVLKDKIKELEAERDRAFKAGLEAAAKEAERVFRVNISRFDRERDAAFDIAVAIRELKEQI